MSGIGPQTGEARAPLISVIIPVYNNQRTIDRAIDSVLAQTVDDFEIVVVDDGSVDSGFLHVAETYADDPRFNLIGPRVNTGPSIARNVGIDAARGEWIALLDGDDAWKPERLAHLLAIAPGADFVADNLTVFDVGAGVETGTQFGRFDIDRLSLEDHLSTWPGARSDTGVLKPIMRKAFLDARGLRYDPAIRCGEDFILYATALCERAVFRLTEHADYVYTAVFGPKSGASSPHSRTVTDGATMAAKLREAGRAYADRLTSAEGATIRRKAVSLEQLTGMWAFRTALRRRDVATCLELLRRDSAIRGRILSAVARRFLGPLGPPKDERIVAHKRPARVK